MTEPTSPERTEVARITTEEVKVYTEAEVRACSLEARARGEECEACQ